MTAKYFTQPGETVIGGLDSSGNPDHVRMNSNTGALIAIPPALQAIYEGKEYFYSAAFELTTTTDVQNYIFETPDSDTIRAHFNFRGTGSAITEVALWEDTVLVTTDATEMTTYNNDRNSTDSADCKIYLASVLTTTDTGSRLKHVKSGAATQYSRSSMADVPADEIFLKQNETYRISFATGTATNLCNLLVYWHEHTDV